LVLQRRERADRLSAPVIDFMSVGFGRRSFLCDVARELQRAVGGCATLHLPDGLWSAVETHLSVMDQAPVLPRAGACSLRRICDLKVISSFGPRALICPNSDIWRCDLEGSKGNHYAQPDRSHYPLPYLNSGLCLRVRHRLQTPQRHVQGWCLQWRPDFG